MKLLRLFDLRRGLEKKIFDYGDYTEDDLKLLNDVYNELDKNDSSNNHPK